MLHCILHVLSCVVLTFQTMHLATCPRDKTDFFCRDLHFCCCQIWLDGAKSDSPFLVVCASATGVCVFLSMNKTVVSEQFFVYLGVFLFASNWLRWLSSFFLIGACATAALKFELGRSWGNLVGVRANSVEACLFGRGGSLPVLKLA